MGLACRVKGYDFLLYPICAVVVLVAFVGLGVTFWLWERWMGCNFESWHLWERWGVWSPGLPGQPPKPGGHYSHTLRRATDEERAHGREFVLIWSDSGLDYEEGLRQFKLASSSSNS